MHEWYLPIFLFKNRYETEVHVPVHVLFRLVSSCLERRISSFSADHEFGVVSGDLPVAALCEVGTTRLAETTTTALLTSSIDSKI